MDAGEINREIREHFKLMAIGIIPLRAGESLDYGGHIIKEGPRVKPAWLRILRCWGYVE